MKRKLRKTVAVSGRPVWALTIADTAAVAMDAERAVRRDVTPDRRSSEP